MQQVSTGSVFNFFYLYPSQQLFWRKLSSLLTISIAPRTIYLFPGPRRSFAKLSVLLRANVKTTMSSAKEIAELDAAKSPTEASLLPPNFQSSATLKEKSAAVRTVMIPRNATVTIKSVEPSAEKTAVTRIMILRETTSRIAEMSQRRPLGQHHRRKLYATASQESNEQT